MQQVIKGDELVKFITPEKNNSDMLVQRNFTTPMSFFSPLKIPSTHKRDSED